MDVINSVVPPSVNGRGAAIQNYLEANVVAGGERGQATVIRGTSLNIVASDSSQASIIANIAQPTIDANELSSRSRAEHFSFGCSVWPRAVASPSLVALRVALAQVGGQDVQLLAIFGHRAAGHFDSLLLECFLNGRV